MNHFMNGFADELVKIAIDTYVPEGVSRVEWERHLRKQKSADLIKSTRKAQKRGALGLAVLTGTAIYGNKKHKDKQRAANRKRKERAGSFADSPEGRAIQKRMAINLFMKNNPGSRINPKHNKTASIVMDLNELKKGRGGVIYDQSTPQGLAYGKKIMQAQRDAPDGEELHFLPAGVAGLPEVEGNKEIASVVGSMGGAGIGAILGELVGRRLSRSGHGGEIASMIGAGIGGLGGGIAGAVLGRGQKSYTDDHIAVLPTNSAASTWLRANRMPKVATVRNLIEKAAAFPQHEAKDAPYDTGGPTAKTMETTQGSSSKTGLKGSPMQTAPGLSKKAPTPLTTPNYMVSG